MGHGPRCEHLSDFVFGLLADFVCLGLCAGSRFIGAFFVAFIGFRLGFVLGLCLGVCMGCEHARGRAREK